MSKTKQFYMKFFTKDFRCDTAVCECSAESVGVYIFIMCLLFDAPHRGKYTLRQESEFDNSNNGNQNGNQNETKTITYKNIVNHPLLPNTVSQNNQNNQNHNQITNQNHNQITNQSKTIWFRFGFSLSKHLPFGIEVIERSLYELVGNGVLYIDGNNLCQKRMLRDADLSAIRTKSGSLGGRPPKKLQINTLDDSQIDPQTDNQNHNQNHNQKTNQKTNQSVTITIKEKEENNILNNDSSSSSGGVGEKIKPKTKTKPKQQLIEITNWSIQMDIDFCLRYFIEKDEFKKDRELVDEIFGHQGVFFKGDELLNSIILWATEFNKINYSKFPQRALRGKESWVSHFTNWLKLQKLNGKPQDVKPNNQILNNPTHIPSSKKDYTIYSLKKD